MADSIKSLNDQLLNDCKALTAGGGQNGGIPFSSYGSGWGTSQIFRSEAAWDSWINDQYSLGNTNQIEKYRQLVGDLAYNSLMVAAIRFLGDSVPEAPLVVKKRSATKDGEGQKGESVVVPDHELTQLWNRPNNFYSGTTLKKGLAFSLVLASNAYALKFMNNAGTKPFELWWEPHWTIRPVWPIDGTQFIKYYEVNRGGQWLPVPLENVIHIRDGIHPGNQRLGFSGNDSVLRELYGDSEAAAYYATLMGGSGIPGFMVSIDKDMKMDQPKLEALEKMIVRKTTGDRKGQPLIAKGARAYKLGFNPRELDLRETRYMAEDRFCAVQGIPAVVLELGTGMAHSIYKNVSEAQERAWRNYICPKLTMIEDELNVQLLEDYEGKNSRYYCQHDLSQVQALQEDQDKKAKRLGGLYTDGGIMLSELRSGMGYGPSDPAQPDKDKVFKIVRGSTLVMPGEQPLPQGESIIDTLTGQVRIEGGSSQQLGMDPSQLGVGSPVNSPGPMLSLVKALVYQQPTVKELPPYIEPNSDGWVDFAPELGSLKIPRTSMPQIKSEHRGAMIQFLKGRGISHTKEEVLATSLKPTQAEYRPDKVALAKTFTGPQRPILVSSDDYVVDGHHQWLSATDDPTAKIPIIRLNAPILQVLLEAARFPSSGTKDEKDKFQKAMPNGHQLITQDDIQAAISFLKEHRLNRAAAMMSAKPIVES